MNTLYLLTAAGALLGLASAVVSVLEVRRTRPVQPLPKDCPFLLAPVHEKLREQALRAIYLDQADAEAASIVYLKDPNINVEPFLSALRTRIIRKYPGDAPSATDHAEGLLFAPHLRGAYVMIGGLGSMLKQSHPYLVHRHQRRREIVEIDAMLNAIYKAVGITGSSEREAFVQRLVAELPKSETRWVELLNFDPDER